MSRVDKKKAKYFKKELSAGAVVVRGLNESREYLLLRYEREDEYWGFPKGRVEESEDVREAARREIQEETGLTVIEFIEGFEKRVRYFFRKEDTLISKEVVYFLCRALEGEVKISFEHKEFSWLPYREAIKKVTYNKEVLEAAETFLEKYYDQSAGTLF